jgi:NTE family protein
MAEALCEAGVRPDLIIGTSAGSLNGAWLAAHPGHEGLAKLRNMWLSVRRKDVFPVSPGRFVLGIAGRRDHLVSSDALRRWLEARVPVSRLEDVAIPFHVMATDLMTGGSVRLSTGTLIDALLASTAIPGVFPPVSLGDRLLVDGGISADTPVGEAVDLGADTVYVLPTVGVDDEARRPKGAAAVALQAMAHILGHASDSEIQANADRCNLYVVPAPPTSQLSPFSFAHTRTLIEEARSVTRDWLRTATPMRPEATPIS